MEEKGKKARRRRITPTQVEQRLMEIAERCMENTPRMVYNKSTRQWEEDGSYTFDAANAIKALTEIGKYLGVGEKAEESVREIPAQLKTLGMLKKPLMIVMSKSWKAIRISSMLFAHKPKS